MTKTTQPRVNLAEMMARQTQTAPKPKAHAGGKKRFSLAEAMRKLHDQGVKS